MQRQCRPEYNIVLNFTGTQVYLFSSSATKFVPFNAHTLTPLMVTFTSRRACEQYDVKQLQLLAKRNQLKGRSKLRTKAELCFHLQIPHRHNAWTLPELRRLATKRKLQGRSRLRTKAQLCSTLLKNRVGDMPSKSVWKPARLIPSSSSSSSQAVSSSSEPKNKGSIYFEATGSDRESIHAWYTSLPKSTKFIFFTGAGISVSAGLPTFQSAARGINMQDIFNYDTVIERRSQPQLDYFMKFTAEMRQKVLHLTARHSIKAKTTRFHAWTQAQPNLALWVSFNIDGLETEHCSAAEKERVTRTLIRAHGSLDDLQCNACKQIIGFNHKQVNEIVAKGLLRHKDCQSNTKRGKNIRSWFRPAVTLYGNDPEAGRHAEAVSTRLNKEVRKHQKTIKSKLVVLIAGLSLRTPEMRKYMLDVLKSIHQLHNTETVWVNPAAPSKTLVPYLTKIAQVTADEFATECQPSK